MLCHGQDVIPFHGWITFQGVDRPRFLFIHLLVDTWVESCEHTGLVWQPGGDLPATESLSV